MSSGVLRILTALVGAPIVLLATIKGGVSFTLLVAGAVVVCQYEYYDLTGVLANKPLAVAAIAAGVGAVLGFAAPVFFGLSLVMLVLIVGMFPFVWQTGSAISGLGSLVSGIVYPAFMLGTLVGVRGVGEADLGLHLTILSLVLVWSSDTFAYYVGRSMGRHQLTPISPKKTWEGSIGGLAGAALVGAALKIIWIGDTVTWIEMAMLVIICGAFGQLGDIFESKLKRAANVKDSGSLLPGHGGMLDRLDAVIFVAPLVYAVFVLIPKYMG